MIIVTMIVPSYLYENKTLNITEIQNIKPQMFLGIYEYKNSIFSLN